MLRRIIEFHKRANSEKKMNGLSRIQAEVETYVLLQAWLIRMIHSFSKVGCCVVVKSQLQVKSSVIITCWLARTFLVFNLFSFSSLCNKKWRQGRKVKMQNLLFQQASLGGFSFWSHFPCLLCNWISMWFCQFWESHSFSFFGVSKIWIVVSMLVLGIAACDCICTLVMSQRQSHSSNE